MGRKRLVVEEKAQDLLVQVDLAAKRIRGSQYADLKRQLFKTSLSVVSNIAEGKQKGDLEFLRFLKIAVGSAGELEVQLESAGKCCLIPSRQSKELNDRASEIVRMLIGLIKKLKRDLGLSAEDEDEGESDTDHESGPGSRS